MEYTLLRRAARLLIEQPAPDRAACTFLQEWAGAGRYPYSQPPSARAFSNSGDACPTAQAFLDGFIRWATFCETYQPEHCQLAAEIERQVADANRA